MSCLPHWWAGWKPGQRPPRPSGSCSPRVWSACCSLWTSLSPTSPRPSSPPLQHKKSGGDKKHFFKLPPCAFHLFSRHGGRILTRKQRAQTTHWFCYNCSSPHQVLLGVMNATNGATKSTKCDTRWSFTCSNAPWSGPTSQNKNVYFQALPSTSILSSWLSCLWLSLSNALTLKCCFWLSTWITTLSEGELRGYVKVIWGLPKCFFVRSSRAWCICELYTTVSAPYLGLISTEGTMRPPMVLTTIYF